MQAQKLQISQNQDHNQLEIQTQMKITELLQQSTMFNQMLNNQRKNNTKISIPNDFQSQKQQFQEKNEAHFKKHECGAENVFSKKEKAFNCNQNSSLSNMSESTSYNNDSDDDIFAIEKKKYTLVLDLDDTLIHYNIESNTIYQRPFLQQFLAFASENYEIIIFTSAEQKYAEQIIEKIDCNKVIQKCYYRQHMKKIQNEEMVKDLSILRKSNLSKVIFVDDIQENLQQQPTNGYLIKPFNDQIMNDIELVRLGKLLNEIVEKEIKDIRKFLSGLQIEENQQSLLGFQQKLERFNQHKNQSARVPLAIIPGDFCIRNSISQNNFRIDSIGIQIETPPSYQSSYTNTPPSNNCLSQTENTQQKQNSFSTIQCSELQFSKIQKNNQQKNQNYPTIQKESIQSLKRQSPTNLEEKEELFQYQKKILITQNLQKTNEKQLRLSEQQQYESHFNILGVREKRHSIKLI